MLGLVYVNVIGKDSDSEYIYEFYFSEHLDTFWLVEANISPAIICNLTVPEKTVYDSVKILKTSYLLDVAQKNSCFSYQDCISGIIPVAWENIDDADEYPDDGRLIFPFGFEINYVEQTLARRNLLFEDSVVNNNPFE